MLVTSDNDVGAPFEFSCACWESADNAALLEILGVAFTDFRSLGLSQNAADRVVWLTCQVADPRDAHPRP